MLAQLFRIIRTSLFRRRLKGTFLTGKMPFRAQRLCRFLEHLDIRVLDVGARGGSMAQLKALAPFAQLFLCEPEPGEAGRLGKGDAPWKKVTIVREALASTSGPVMLNVLRAPGLSSLLLPDQAYIARYWPPGGGKKFARENWEVANEIRVGALTLDAAARKYEFGNLSFMKLDTQGTELDILRSGLDAVVPELVAVYVEVEFIPLYRRQPLFGQVNQFLTAEGFRLLDIQRTCVRRRSERMPRYSKKELIYGHALYIREQSRAGGALTTMQALRLVALALAFEYFDLALWLLESPGVKEFLEHLRIEDLAEDIIAYANETGAYLDRGYHLAQARRVFADTDTDRSYER